MFIHVLKGRQRDAMNILKLQSEEIKLAFL